MPQKEPSRKTVRCKAEANVDDPWLRGIANAHRCQTDSRKLLENQWGMMMMISCRCIFLVIVKTLCVVVGAN
jgi:hypothetical protein